MIDFPFPTFKALVSSSNLVSVRLLRSIGIDYAITYMSRFGFHRKQFPRGLSLALGSVVLTPLDLASGYAVFANGGYRVVPHYIERIRSANGKTVWEASAARCPSCLERGSWLERAISPQNAYLMPSMMADVIRRGTARAALVLGREDLAGKTGTTDEWRDAWFSGFNSVLLATAWVSFDQPRSLGEGETGGRAALAMWIDFVGQALKGVPEQPLQPPPGIVTARIDPDTGLLAGPEQRNAVSETFQADSTPAHVADKPLTGRAASLGLFRTMEQAF